MTVHGPLNRDASTRMAFAASALLLLGGAVGAQPAPGPGPAPQDPIVVTTGASTVRAAPDRAVIALSTTARASSPVAAQRQSADAMAAVRKALAANGLTEQAVRTVRYDVQPLFDYVNGKQVSRGYQASNGIEVRVDALDRVGAVLDAVVGAGATDVGGVRFDLRDRETLEREALKQAVAVARAKADAAAAGVGRAIDAIIRIEESGLQAESPQPVMMRMAAERVAAEPTVVSPGEIEITARVTLTARLAGPRP